MNETKRQPTHLELLKRFKERPNQVRAAAKRFTTTARGSDFKAFTAAFQEVLQLCACREAFRTLARSGEVHGEIKNAFVGNWIRNGDALRDELSDDILLVSALRHLLPTYHGSGVTLYRGAGADERRYRRYGASWTSSVDVALGFAAGAKRNMAKGGTVVLSAFAPPDAIVFAPAIAANGYGEDEYIVDRRRLRDVKVEYRFGERPAGEEIDDEGQD